MKRINLSLAMALCLGFLTSATFANTNDPCSELTNTSWSGKMHADFYNTQSCMGVTLHIEAITPLGGNSSSLQGSITVQPSDNKVSTQNFTLTKAVCSFSQSSASQQIVSLDLSGKDQKSNTTIYLSTHNLNAGSGVFTGNLGNVNVAQTILYRGGNPNASCSM